MHDITIDNICDARARFQDAVRRTPVFRSSALSTMTGGDVWLKAENLQATGSFKIRGAMSRIGVMTPDERARGVIAASAGNHAQGVAVAARAYGVHATIVMPRTTPLAKVQATRGYGAEVILDGDSYEDARVLAGELTRERNLVPVPAFDDPLIVAGQGTVGIEIVEDLGPVQTVLVPVGGGGLAAGIGIAVKTLEPGARVIGVQVEAAPGVQRSLAEGRAEQVPPAPTIAEGVAVAGPGDVTFPLLQRCLDDVVVVSEDEVAQAMVLLLERSKLVVEGAGAVGVAALMSGKVRVSGLRAVAVLSGGNVDINMVARVVEHGLMQAGRYFSLTVGLDDKPGQLATLASLLSASGANVLSVAHHRFGIALPVGRVQVVLLLEVRDRDHARDVERALEEAGFARGEERGPEFVPSTWRTEAG
ncbi:MAG TPA: threonine ammonia-lyase [Dehalococcoidia bacterium]|nr:threonine ammonia-lyase [Dehalococcoidia bacterium]